MNKCLPPPILVETWIFVATSSDKSLSKVKLPIWRNINEIFGSIELARIYVVQSKEEDVEIHFV